MDIRNPLTRLTFFLLLVLLGYPSLLWAQLTASFSPDKPGSCAPAVFSFTNNSTGAGPDARFMWDLGNGNSSNLRNPSATYTEPGDYTIKLTITDGDRQSTTTQKVTVYKNPIADLNVAQSKICIPDPARFEAMVTPGSGQIQNLTWDFGDGNTQTQWGNTEAIHVYSTPQIASVSLTVSNSFGCHTSVVRKNIIQVFEDIKVNMEPDKLFVCSRNDKVVFSNTSTGPGTLTYLWEFGDGKTSSEREPEHIFEKAGTYQVSLKVTSSEGCSRMSTPVTIHVENFITSFSTQNLLCAENGYTFTNTSSPTPTQTLWTIGNNATLNIGNAVDGAWTFGAAMNLSGTNTITTNAGTSTVTFNTLGINGDVNLTTTS